MLIIEVDGITHETEKAQVKDQQRDQDLEGIGFTVLRFSNWEVLHRMGDVSEQLVTWIEERDGEVG
jgi:very-short-patch-repair endonuclease